MHISVHVLEKSLPSLLCWCDGGGGLLQKAEWGWALTRGDNGDDTSQGVMVQHAGCIRGDGLYYVVVKSWVTFSLDKQPCVCFGFVVLLNYWVCLLMPESLVPVLGKGRLWVIPTASNKAEAIATVWTNGLQKKGSVMSMKKNSSPDIHTFLQLLMTFGIVKEVYDVYIKVGIILQEKALSLVLVDAVVSPDDLVDTAHRWALDILDRRRPWGASLNKNDKLEPLNGVTEILQIARAPTCKQAPNLQHPLLCIDTVEEDIVSGLMPSDACWSLVHILLCPTWHHQVLIPFEKPKPPRLESLCLEVVGRHLEDFIDDLAEIFESFPSDIKMAMAAIARTRKLLTDDVVLTLADSSWEILDVSGSSILDFGLSKVAKIGKHLKDVDISRCSELTSAGVSELLQHCSSLEILRWGGCPRCERAARISLLKPRLNDIAGDSWEEPDTTEIVHGAPSLRWLLWPKVDDQVSADGLLISGHSLSINESSMTGEAKSISCCPTCFPTHRPSKPT